MASHPLSQGKSLVRWLYILGFVLLLVALAAWWSKASLTPQKVFEGMLEQSLTTNGVAMLATQEEGGAKLEQAIQYSLGATNSAVSRTTLTQGGAVVTTEVVGTIEADYTRYVSIQTDRVDAQGKPLDLSNITGVWAKSENLPTGSTLMSQAALGLSTPLGAIPVPIGNLTPEKRDQLLQQIRNEQVYQTDYSKAKKEVKNGRVRYIYEVKMQAIPYVHLMKSFAQALGLHDLDDLDQNSYQTYPEIVVEMTVDARSRRLVSVHLPDSGYTLSLEGYDVPVAAKPPEKFVPADELQKRIDALQE